MARKNKIGRNDLCWCNSGKKFKNCHLDREKNKQVSKWELKQWLDDRYKKDYASILKQVTTRAAKKSLGLIRSKRVKF